MSRANNTTAPVNDLPHHLEQRRTALKVSELAHLLSISTKQIYALVEKCAIPSYRIAGSIRFDPILTAQWLRSQVA